VLSVFTSEGLDRLVELAESRRRVAGLVHEHDASRGAVAVATPTARRVDGFELAARSGMLLRHLIPALGESVDVVLARGRARLRDLAEPVPLLDQVVERVANCVAVDASIDGEMLRVTGGERALERVEWLGWWGLVSVRLGPRLAMDEVDPVLDSAS
jgi:hypothetical protein